MSGVKTHELVLVLVAVLVVVELLLLALPQPIHPTALPAASSMTASRRVICLFSRVSSDTRSSVATMSSHHVVRHGQVRRL
jgi:hypothetical protein